MTVKKAKRKSKVRPWPKPEPLTRRQAIHLINRVFCDRPAKLIPEPGGSWSFRLPFEGGWHEINVLGRVVCHIECRQREIDDHAYAIAGSLVTAQTEALLCGDCAEGQWGKLFDLTVEAMLAAISTATATVRAEILTPAPKALPPPPSKAVN